MLTRTTKAIAVCAAVTATLVAPLARAAEPGAMPVEPTIGPLISGAVSVLHGTHVWTDYAYDDRGADSSTPSADNVADLIQLQLTPGTDSLQIRAVLETLTDEKVPLLGIGIDTDNRATTGAPALPGWSVNADGRPLGLERLVLIDSDGARVENWVGTWEEAGSASSVVDAAANTIDASIPNALLGASSTTWGVVGILGTTGASWFDGGGPISDLAYVHDDSYSGQTWQSEVQAAVLSGTEDAAKAIATIDGSSLGADRPAEPVPGVKNTFLYRSTLRLGEGVGTLQDRKYAGPYQPYVVWFPAAWKDAMPSQPPMVVYLHGAMQSHLDGSYGATGDFVSAGPVALGTGVIAPNAVVMTPLGRNETSLGYAGASEQDILDAITDVSNRFNVDDDRVALTGYSLGGVGTFNLAQLYPDKWAGAVEIVGAPDLGVLTAEEEAGGAQTMPNELENLRNLRLRMAHSRADELELLVSDQPDQTFVAMEQLGYDFRYYQFYRRDHLTFPVATIQCELDQALRDGREKDPAEVVFSQEPKLAAHEDASGLDLHHDRAYWLSDMIVRGDNFQPGDKGTVDVTNLARADQVPIVSDVVEAHQNITEGRDVCGPNPAVQTNDAWTTLGKAWTGFRAPQPTSNGLRVKLTRVRSVQIDVTRMRDLDLTRPLQLEITSDGPSTIRLPGRCPDAVDVDAGTTTVVVGPCS